MRFNMPFGRVGAGEFGTYFIGYAHTPALIELMLTTCSSASPQGNYDRILDFSTATHRQPVLRAARRLPRRPSRALAVAAAEPARRPMPAGPPAAPRRRHAASAEGSLAIGSLREEAREPSAAGACADQRGGVADARSARPRTGWHRRSAPAGWSTSPAPTAGSTPPPTSGVRAALKGAPVKGIRRVQRRVLPLVELRASFELPMPS